MKSVDTAIDSMGLTFFKTHFFLELFTWNAEEFDVNLF